MVVLIQPPYNRPCLKIMKYCKWGMIRWAKLSHIEFKVFHWKTFTGKLSRRLIFKTPKQHHYTKIHRKTLWYP